VAGAYFQHHAAFERDPHDLVMADRRPVRLGELRRKT
jgi:hypothetical protein